MEKTHMPGEQDIHDQVQQLLPWRLTGRLEPSDEAFVEGHLAECPRCQAELEAERDLQAFVNTAEVDVERDWSRLAERIKAAERRGQAADQPAGKVAAFRRRPTRMFWAGAAIAAQLTLILVMGSQLMFREPAAMPYRALGAPAPVAARFMIEFRPDAAEASLREALTSAGARIVDGPTTTGAYVVQAPWADRAQALRTLRARPEVLLAESLDPAGAP